MTQKKDAPTYYNVLPDYQDQRIDNHLITYLKGLPRSLLYRLLRTGKIRVNKKRVKPHYRLQAGDIIYIPTLRLEPLSAHQISPDKIAWLEERILYEDAFCLVINKPSGIPVHGGVRMSLGIIEGLRCLRPKLSHMHLVHRLDQATSGCLLIAKDRMTLKALQALFIHKSVQKDYLAFLVGQWQKPKVYLVSAPLRAYRPTTTSIRYMQVDQAKGKEATSEFYLLKQYRLGTLVRVRLKTGRMHQIRAHAKWIGHPIAGDQQYGDRHLNHDFSLLGLKRMFLHASVLGFKHPNTQTWVEVRAPLELVLSNFLKRSQTLNDEKI